MSIARQGRVTSELSLSRERSGRPISPRAKRATGLTASEASGPSLSHASETSDPPSLKRATDLTASEANDPPSLTRARRAAELNAPQDQGLQRREKRQREKQRLRKKRGANEQKGWQENCDIVSRVGCPVQGVQQDPLHSRPF